MNNFNYNKINNLQTPTPAPTIPTTIYYLGFIFTAGAVVGSLIGIMLTKK